MEIKFRKGFADRLNARFGQYDLQVGVLSDGPHLEARGRPAALGTYAGGPVRKKSREPSGVTIAEVSAANRERLGINFLTYPFKLKTSEIIKFTEGFFKLAFGRSEPRRLENLLQAIVRNPILRGEYGGNGPTTKRRKGFDRGMIDTAQLFKAIKASVSKRGGR